MSSLPKIHKRSIQTIRDAFFIDFFFYEPLNLIIEIKTLSNEYNNHFIIHLPKHCVNLGFQLTPFSEIGLYSDNNLIETVRSQKQFPEIPEKDRIAILEQCINIIKKYLFSIENRKLNVLKS